MIIVTFLPTFAADRVMVWRESSTGISMVALFVARAAFDVFEMTIIAVRPRATRTFRVERRTLLSFGRPRTTLRVY